MERLFNDGWLFSADGGEFVSVNLPHDYQITLPRAPECSGSQGFYPHAGRLVYEKHFTAPFEWAGMAVELLFDGAQRFAKVYLNGELITGHKYGYTPFCADLTGKVLIGAENVLRVTLDNSDSGDRWYSGMGIYRNVTLRVSNPCRIAPWGVKATHVMDGRDALLDIHVDVLGGADCEVEASICGLTARGGSALSLRIPAPALWDVDAPNLHQLTVRLLYGGAEVDERVVRLGFREAAFDADAGFFLNGRNLKLKGVNLHHDGGAFGAAVPLDVWRRRLSKLKELGANAIRTSHNPQAAEVYDLCDEMGFLVIDELYDKWDGTELYFKDIFPTDRFSDLRAMIARDVNHPSIILWSVGNEVEIQYSEAFYTYLAELRAEVRRLDPTRGMSMALISYVLKNSNEWTPLEDRLAMTVRYGELVDVFLGNYMESFYVALRARGLNKAFIGSEILSYYRFEELSNSRLVPVSPWNDVERHSWVAGGFYWAGIDYLGESSGWPCHGWTGCPIDSAGFLKPRAHHIMSQWREEPMVKLAVFDDSKEWDMANSMWSFPELAADWNQGKRGRIYRVAAFTNCDTVKVYQEGRFPQTATPDADERIAHFYLPWSAGTLRAEGYRSGEKVCEDILITTAAPAQLALSEWGRGEVIQVEAHLLDAEGQIYTRARPELRVEVEGAELVKLVSGDFLATDAVPRMHEGHMLIVLRPTGGAITLTARAEGVPDAVLVL